MVTEFGGHGGGGGCGCGSASQPPQRLPLVSLRARSWFDSHRRVCVAIMLCISSVPQRQRILPAKLVYDLISACVSASHVSSRVDVCVARVCVGLLVLSREEDSRLNKPIHKSKDTLRCELASQ